VENKDKQPEIILKELRRSYQIAFSTKEGKEVLTDLELRTGIHSSTFDTNSSRAAYLEGMRAVTLYIKGMLKPNTEKK
tara:strand:+ start:2163 stop:2396 length:234 start_codon:yes stop_codon:yes gene_type:complete